MSLNVRSLFLVFTYSVQAQCQNKKDTECHGVISYIGSQHLVERQIIRLITKKGNKKAFPLLTNVRSWTRDDLDINDRYKWQFAPGPEKLMISCTLEYYLWSHNLHQSCVSLAKSIIVLLFGLLRIFPQKSTNIKKQQNSRMVEYTVLNNAVHTK